MHINPSLAPPRSHKSKRLSHCDTPSICPPSLSISSPLAHTPGVVKHLVIYGALIWWRPSIVLRLAVRRAAPLTVISRQLGRIVYHELMASSAHPHLSIFRGGRRRVPACEVSFEIKKVESGGGGDGRRFLLPAALDGAVRI